MKQGWLFTIATMVLLAGCSGIRVYQDYDPESEFSDLTTFQWVAETQEVTGDPRIDNPLRDARIRAAVIRVLAEKGHGEVDKGRPAFYVQYRYLLRKKIESSGTAGGVTYGVGSFGHRGGVAIGTGNQVQDYDEASLVIDFMKNKSGDLLWRGVGEQRFAEYGDPKKATKAMDALVRKVLDQFPPKVSR